jgi:hypothetical protein
MFTSPVQLNDVIYNAANQTFEASVTIYDKGIVQRYACAINAPISTTFVDAAAGLKSKALHLHSKGAGLHSSLVSSPKAQTDSRQSFDPSTWLRAILTNPAQITA